MPLTTCRECGTAVPAHSHVCPTCGAVMAPVPHAAYRPAPPRPPEPERPWWKTVGGWGSAVGWVFIVGVLVLIAAAFVRGSAERGRRNTETAEMAREEAHVRKVFGMMQDTLPNAPALDTTARPVPTSDRAKRVWVISRMLAHRWAWEREVMERHGVRGHRPPGVLETAHYQANARDYPAVGTYLEGRAAAIAEIEKTSAAWVEERIAALARESGLPAREIRDLFPRDFGGMAGDYAGHVNAMLDFHRHHVRADPRVRGGGGDMLLWQRENEGRRSDELAAKARAAADSSTQARARRLAEEVAAINRLIG